jgi:hypothetical protein
LYRAEQMCQQLMSENSSMKIMIEELESEIERVRGELHKADGSRKALSSQLKLSQAKLVLLQHDLEHERDRIMEQISAERDLQLLSNDASSSSLDFAHLPRLTLSNEPHASTGPPLLPPFDAAERARLVDELARARGTADALACTNAELQRELESSLSELRVCQAAIDIQLGREQEERLRQRDDAPPSAAESLPAKVARLQREVAELCAARAAATASSDDGGAPEARTPPPGGGSGGGEPGGTEEALRRAKRLVCALRGRVSALRERVRALEEENRSLREGRPRHGSLSWLQAPGRLFPARAATAGAPGAQSRAGASPAGAGRLWTP